MRLRLTAFALAALAVTACGGDKSVGPSGTVTGSYTLQSFNGKQVPVTVSDNGTTRAELLGGTLALNANSSYTESVTVRETVTGLSPATQTTTCSGTWTQASNTVSFTEAPSVTGGCGGSYAGMFTNENTLSLTLGGGTLVYTK